jgi:hypothetical protein
VAVAVIKDRAVNLIRPSLRRPAHPRIPLAALIACLFVAIVPASAVAATRYASPTGTGATPCVEAAPCSLEDALSEAKGLAAGDTVLLRPGTYDPATELTVSAADVTISAEPAKAAPLVDLVGEHGFVDTKKVTLEDLRFHAGATAETGLTATGAGSVVERVESTGKAREASCDFGGGSTIRNSLCVDDSAEGAGIAFVAPSGSLEAETRLLNDTAIGSRGIFASAEGDADVSLLVDSTIARGREFDVYGEVTEPAMGSVLVQIGSSNYETKEATGGARIEELGEGSNQSAAPVFVDAEGGDYREAESSPTRFAGDPSIVRGGELDLAGEPRTSTCDGKTGVDIGAYQFQCAPPSQTPPSTPPAAGSSGSGGTPQKSGPPPAPAQPRLSGLVLKPRRFARRTKISFTLSAPARVKLEILARRKGKGKAPRLVKLGQLTKGGTAGPNTVAFDGRLKGRPLAPGAYTLRASAAGRSVTTTFTITGS